MKKRQWLAAALALVLALSTAALGEETAAQAETAASAEAAQTEAPAANEEKQTTAPSRTAAPSSSGGSIRSGSTGTAVAELQRNLHALGYYNGSITGNAGALTVAAIKRFQKANGLAQDGVAGAKTLAAIQKALSGKKQTAAPTAAATAAPAKAKNIRSGSEGENVRKLQEDLKALGIYTGTVTGKAGLLTVNAIRQFQREHNLTADGIAGAKTLSAIEAALTEQKGRAEKTKVPTQEATPKPTEPAAEETETPAVEKTETPKPAEPTSTPAKAQTIRSGSEGEDVRQLQQNLKTLGVYSGTVTGKAGALTVSAIRKFQREHKLSVDGIAGEQTLAAIQAALAEQKANAAKTAAPAAEATPKPGNAATVISYSAAQLNVNMPLKLYSRGSEVTALQKALKALGYFAGQETGFFGTYTEGKLREFQKDNRITVTGEADRVTLSAINRMLSTQ